MNCDRCGEKTGAFITSYFNTEIICMDCQKKESAHPQYEHAREVEIAAVERGDYNFPGIGLPDDLRVKGQSV